MLTFEKNLRHSCAKTFSPESHLIHLWL